MRDCTPVRHGVYFATYRPIGWRSVVKVDANGHGHTRVFVPRFSASFGLEEFKDWVGPLVDPAGNIWCQDGGGI